MSHNASPAQDPYQLLSPAALADPYPVYERLRSEDPVHWSQAFQGWILTRYGDIKELLSTPRIGVSKIDGRALTSLPEDLQRQWGDISRFVAQWVSSMDPPDHRRLRHLLNVGFKPRMVEQLGPRIQAIVDELLDAVRDADQLEIIRDFAYPLPAMVIAELLGVPTHDRPLLRVWSQKIVAFFHIANRGQRAHVEAMHQAIAEMRDYLGMIIAERRRVPQEDLISYLLATGEQGAMLSEEELLATCTLLLFAGHETTMNLIGNGLLALLRHPDQYQQLGADLLLTPGAVEEFLRYDSPVQFAWRAAVDDIAIDGRTIRASERLICCLGAANRDPAQFPDPSRLDIRRPNAATHISFGHGIHFCLGAPLARLEAQIAFPTLLRRLPGLRLTDAPATWGESMAVHGLRALPVTFDHIRPT